MPHLAPSLADRRRRTVVPTWMSVDVGYETLCFGREPLSYATAIYTQLLLCADVRHLLFVHPHASKPSDMAVNGVQSNVRVAEERNDPSSSRASATGVMTSRDEAVSQVQQARRRSTASGEPPRPIANARASSMQRYLDSQKNVDQEVLQLYKLVCGQ